MNRMFKLLTLGIAIAVIAAIVVPLTAQDGIVEPSGPGEGGVIVDTTLNSDPSTFNPLIGNDTASSNIYVKMYPNFLGINDDTFVYEGGAPDGIVASWEYDETGTILTLRIREDMFWSDGEQITADDYLWAANAIQSGLTSSPRTSSFYQLADGTVVGGAVHEITKVDDFTIQVRIGTVETDENGENVLDEDGNLSLLPACDAIIQLNAITPVPSHAYEAQFGDDYAAMDSDPYFYPGTSFGPFNDPFLDFGVQTSLIASQEYTDTKALDYVAAGEYVVEVYADSNVGYERFLAGDYSIFGIPAAQQNDFRDLADSTGDFQYVEYAQNGYQWVGLNLADPTNPQPAVDADGNYIDQGLHPIFGDVRVRHAFAYGIDVLEMIGTRPDGDNPSTGILEGNGEPLATHDHPIFSQTRDLYAELGLELREYNPELAMSLLEEAGWVDGDGDGIRECTGCLYATEVDPSFEGSPLTFVLNTNAGNVARESIGETIKAQLEAIGFSVDFQAVEFGTLVDILTGQTYDAIILGWSMTLPFAPGDSMDGLFNQSGDIPGSGFNFTSYQNPEFDAIIRDMGALPGCDPEERNAAYAQAQYMLWEDAPYIWLYVGNVMAAAQADLANYNPIPNNIYWNLDDWVALDPNN